MYDYELKGFKDKPHYEWLKKRVSELEYAIKNKLRCDSTDDIDLLTRKLAGYQKGVKEIQEKYGIQD